MKMIKKLFETLYLVLCCCLISAISAITGYGMFWFYIVSSFSRFTSIFVGMFTSAIVMIILLFFWNKKYESPDIVKNSVTRHKGGES